MIKPRPTAYPEEGDPTPAMIQYCHEDTVPSCEYWVTPALPAWRGASAAAVRMQLGHSQMDSFLPTPDASHMGTRAMWRQRGQGPGKPKVM